MSAAGNANPKPPGSGPWGMGCGRTAIAPTTSCPSRSLSGTRAVPPRHRPPAPPGATAVPSRGKSSGESGVAVASISGAVPKYTSTSDDQPGSVRSASAWVSNDGRSKLRANGVADAGGGERGGGGGGGAGRGVLRPRARGRGGRAGGG